MPISARRRLLAPLAPWLMATSVGAAAPFRARKFTVRGETPLQHAGPDFCWFHPRVAAIPSKQPRVVMTLSQHLDADDHYSGLWYMYTDDLGASWKGPFAPPHLAAAPAEDGLHTSVHDVTPGWHAKSGKVLAIGARTYYSATGKHLSGEMRKGGTAYASYDGRQDKWSNWQMLELPNEPLFANCRSACSQWIEKGDGTLLLPVYCQQEEGNPCDLVTVLQCRYDGAKLTYLKHGTVLSQNTHRGLAEPSIAFVGGRYFLTIRHDERGYVTASKDGLEYSPLKVWTNDDGSDLGSFNTQQHWVTHRDALYLCYTSRRPHNRHIARARAPIFMAQVDPDRLQVVRSTEQVLIPERGLMLGNFGAATITANEAWVTDAEFLWYSHGYKPTEKGGNGSVWVARVNWS